MSPARFSRISELLLAANDLPPEQRRAFLESHCADDAELIAEVESLLAAERERVAQIRVDRAAAPAAVRHMNQLLAGGEPSPLAGSGPSEPLPAIPARIGHYRILRKIGEGGMGTVFEAEQDHPRRRVALKVLRPGFASSEVLLRFRREANLLGQLRHAGIAQIFEAGTAEQAGGWAPFLAMELIEGRPLTEYADTARLDVRQRLALLAEVCDAVQHAHERGVVHRDLKPANILVVEEGTEARRHEGMKGKEERTERGASSALRASVPSCLRASPKILDFGVARITDADTRTMTLQTEVGQLIGTVPYMSPEQVVGDPGQIDARSDVYALGVIGYELLAGKLPHDVCQRSIPEAARIIREQEPTRLATISSRFRGDIDTIIIKSLDKDRDRRYSSAADLAADIRHYLRDEPIVARPASAMYQLRKFARRNKVLVGGVAATILALAAGLTGTIAYAWRATHQRSLAEFARDDARRQAAKADAARSFLMKTLAQANPEHNPAGKEMTVLQMLDAAAERVAFDFPGQPELEAQARHTLGQAYLARGRFAEAQAQLSRAEELQRGREPAGELDLAETFSTLAVLFTQTADIPRADQYARESLALLQRLRPDDADVILKAENTVCNVLTLRGEFIDAGVCFRELLERARSIVDSDSETLALIRSTYAMQLYQVGNFDEAEPLFRETAEMLRRTHGETHPDYLEAVNNLAVVLRNKGELEAAESIYRAVLTAAHRVYGDAHPRIATTLSNLARVKQAQREYAEAERFFRDALELRKRLFGAESSEVAGGYQLLGLLLDESGQIERAAEALREGTRIARLHTATDPSSTDAVLFDLAEFCWRRQRWADGVALWRERIGMAAAGNAQSQNGLNFSKLRLGFCLREMGEYGEAERVLLEAHAEAVAKSSPESGRSREIARELEMLYARTDRPAQADAWRLRSSTLAPATEQR